MVEIYYVDSLDHVWDVEDSWAYFQSVTKGIPHIAISFLKKTIVYSGQYSGSRRLATSENPITEDLLDLSQASRVPLDPPQGDWQFEIGDTQDYQTVNIGGTNVPHRDVDDFLENAEERARLSGNSEATDTAEQSSLAIVGAALDSSVNWVGRKLDTALRFVPNLATDILTHTVNLGVDSAGKLVRSLGDFLGTSTAAIAQGTSTIATGLGGATSQVVDSVGQATQNLGSGVAQTFVGAGQGISTSLQGGGIGLATGMTGLGTASGQIIGGVGQNLLSGNAGITLAIIAGLYFFSQKK